MKRIKLLILGVLLVPLSLMAVEKWDIYEASFESSKTYDNPFMEVKVEIVFSKDGKEWKQPAF